MISSNVFVTREGRKTHHVIARNCLMMFTALGVLCCTSTAECRPLHRKAPNQAFSARACSYTHRTFTTKLQICQAITHSRILSQVEESKQLDGNAPTGPPLTTRIVQANASKQLQTRLPH